VLIPVNFIVTWTLGLTFHRIGPVDLTERTVAHTHNVPTVTDNLLSQGTILLEEIGLFFEPSSVSSSGELTFGEIDTSRTTSSITFTPITTTFPASQFWGINESISIGGETILNLTAGIVDTGTTLVLLATGACVPVLEVTRCTPLEAHTVC
jgi:saccharopepsin